MNSNEIKAHLKEFQQSKPGRSGLNVLLTAMIGYGSVILGIILFTDHPVISFSLFPFSIAAFCRSFIILHDAGHLALFRNRFLNSLSGNLVGFLIMIPNALWRQIHNLHHATIGNLDKRNINPELWTMTKKEYRESPAGMKLLYRIMRSRFNRLIITPFALFIVARLPLPRLNWKGKIAALVYDVLYACIIYFSLRFEFWQELLIIYLIPLFVFNIIATIIFYLQHQFEDTLWMKDDQWDMYQASIEGSSYLKLNPFFQWMTGNVGFHNIHHLNPNIPFYLLPKAHKTVEDHINYKEVRFYEILRHLKGKVWDEESKRLIHYSGVNLK